MAGTLPIEYPFFKEDGYTDVILVVDGRRLCINSCILGYTSSHFQRLFNHALKTASTDKSGKKRIPEIKISDKSYEDFVELLAFYHPAVAKQLTEKTALRLLPLAHEYHMSSLKFNCENILVSALKKMTITPQTVPKGTPVYKNRKDNAPELLLNCTIAADAANSKTILEQCIRIWSNPTVPIKELKATPDISDPVKARIYENRMTQESKKLENVTGELEKEKEQNEQLQKKLLESLGGRSPRGKNANAGRMKRYGSDPELSASGQQTTTKQGQRQANQKSSSKDFKKYR